MKNKEKLIKAMTALNSANQDLSELWNELEDSEREIIDEHYPFKFCFGEYVIDFNQFTLKVLRELDKASLTLGHAYFDEFEGDTEFRFKALNRDERWNGWSMPYIHHSEMKKFCAFMSQDPEHKSMRMVGETLLIHNPEESYEEQIALIEPYEINGEKWYYLGGEGLCFNFERNLKYGDLPESALKLIDESKFTTDQFLELANKEGMFRTELMDEDYISDTIYDRWADIDFPTKSGKLSLKQFRETGRNYSKESYFAEFGPESNITADVVRVYEDGLYIEDRGSDAEKRWYLPLNNQEHEFKNLEAAEVVLHDYYENFA